MAVALPLLASLVSSALAQDGYLDRTYKIKAAYLYNFAKYVQWPSSSVPDSGDAANTFTIGVVGGNPFGNSLERIAQQKKLGGKSIRIVSVKQVETVLNCEMLFFSSHSDPRLVDKIFSQVRGHPTLLVGESADFAARGGMINFIIENNKVRFEINARSAADSGVVISSKLLRLGKPVSP